MAKPTINDVARLAGVSKKTVSRVINRSALLSDATRAKVETVIAEIGYVPDPQARALALRRNFLIALVYDRTAEAVLPDVQQAILEAIRGTEFALTVRSMEGDDPDSLAGFRGFLEFQRPFGVLLLPPVSEMEAVAEICRELGCTHVRLGMETDDGAACLAAPGNRAITAGVVSELIALGHRRIGLVAGPDEVRSARELELGYLDAMADHDLDRGPALIATGDYSFESGVAAGRLLLEVSPRPTAIFAGSDEMAAGVLRAAGEKGLSVPDALSIVGYGDSAIASRLWPPLATIRVPIAEMAGVAALRLIGSGEAETEMDPTRFEPRVIMRASVGPVPE